MRFTIAREKLQEGLTAVAASIPAKTTLPVLANILVETAERGIRLSGTRYSCFTSLLTRAATSPQNWRCGTRWSTPAPATSRSPRRLCGMMGCESPAATASGVAERDRRAQVAGDPSRRTDPAVRDPHTAKRANCGCRPSHRGADSGRSDRVTLLTTAPGIGPITASALVATINDITCFRSAREF